MPFSSYYVIAVKLYDLIIALCGRTAYWPCYVSQSLLEENLYSVCFIIRLLVCKHIHIIITQSAPAVTEKHKDYSQGSRALELAHIVGTML